ncbi:MAG: hypothetical protein MUO70_02305 [Euryarchaeota archaeon]|nr:hypothetical protein [Euryarchaeota archaeon]
MRSNNDGTLYLADWPEPSVAKQKSHDLLYYVALLVLLVFILGSLAVTDYIASGDLLTIIRV